MLAYWRLLLQCFYGLVELLNSRAFLSESIHKERLFFADLLEFYFEHFGLIIKFWFSNRVSITRCLDQGLERGVNSLVYGWTVRVLHLWKMLCDRKNGIGLMVEPLFPWNVLDIHLMNVRHIIALKFWEKRLISKHGFKLYISAAIHSLDRWSLNVPRQVLCFDSLAARWVIN